MLLVDKYAPLCIEDMILIPETKKILQDMIKDPVNKFTNITIPGVPGIGKTALAKVLIKELGAECLFLNASKDNSVDIIRSKVSDFCGSVSIANQIKIVLLDEADCLSIGKAGSSGAQETLRGIIEESQADTRFILTCNYQNRIIPALLSRCPLINLSFTPKMVMERMMFILKSEGIKAQKKDLEIFYNDCVKKNFPRIRNIIHALESCINSENQFIVNNIELTKENEDLDNFADNLFDLLNSKKLLEVRKYYIENGDKFAEDYIGLAGLLFKKYMDFPMKQIVIADYIFKMGQVLDPEIQFYSMCIELKNDK